MWIWSWKNELPTVVCFRLDLLWNTFQLSRTSFIHILYCYCFIICGLSLFKTDITPERTVTSLAHPPLAQVGLSVDNQHQLEAGLSDFVRYLPETQQAESVTRRKKRSVWIKKKKNLNSKERRYSGGGCNEHVYSALAALWDGEWVFWNVTQTRCQNQRGGDPIRKKDRSEESRGGVGERKPSPSSTTPILWRSASVKTLMWSRWELSMDLSVFLSFFSCVFHTCWLWLQKMAYRNQDWGLLGDFNHMSTHLEKAGFLNFDVLLSVTGELTSLKVSRRHWVDNIFILCWKWRVTAEYRWRKFLLILRISERSWGVHFCFQYKEM